MEGVIISYAINEPFVTFFFYYAFVSCEEKKALRTTQTLFDSVYFPILIYHLLYVNYCSACIIL